MALSLDSKIKDIMRSPEGKAVMEKWAPGSSKDPLVTLSYLEDVFFDAIMDNFQKYAKEE